MRENSELLAYLELALLSGNGIFRSVFVLISTLMVILLLPQGVSAKDTCRFVPAESQEKFTVRKCSFNESSSTLTCDGSSPTRWDFTEQYEIKYPNKSAFVTEGIEGVQQHSFRSFIWSIEQGSYSEIVSLVHDNGKLLTVTTIVNDKPNEAKTITFTEWDKSGRPIAGSLSKEICEVKGGGMADVTDIPVVVKYDNKRRQRTTVIQFSKGKAASPGSACKSATVSVSESFDMPFGKPKGKAGQKICAE